MSNQKETQHRLNRERIIKMAIEEVITRFNEPGKDPFQDLAEKAKHCPSAKARLNMLRQLAADYASSENSIFWRRRK